MSSSWVVIDGGLVSVIGSQSWREGGGREARRQRRRGKSNGSRREGGECDSKNDEKDCTDRLLHGAKKSEEKRENVGGEDSSKFFWRGEEHSFFRGEGESSSKVFCEERTAARVSFFT